MASSGVISVTYEDCIPAADAPFATGVASPFLVAEREPEWGSSEPAPDRPSPDKRHPSPEENPLDGVPLLIPDWVARDRKGPADAGAGKELAAALARLRGARLAVRRRLGDGLRLFSEGRFDPLEIGPASYADLARKELGIPVRSARDAVRLARGLEEYPLLAQACECGLLSQSHALLLLGVLTPETEAEWIARAEGLSCRELGALIREHRREREGCVRADDPEETAAVAVRGQKDDLDVARVIGRDMVEKVSGGPVGEPEALELMCAEWASTHPEHMPDILETPVRELDLETLLAMGGRIVEEASEDEASEEPAPDRLREPAGRVVVMPTRLERTLPDPGASRSSFEALEILKELMALEQSLDWQAGRVLRACRHREVDFDPEAVLGVSERSSAYLRALDRDLRWRPLVRRAYLTGRLGWMKARTILKICTDRTSEAWIAWAETATVRLLDRAVEAEVSAWSLNAPHWRTTTGGLPPNEKRLRALGILPGCAWADRDRIREAASVCREKESSKTLEALFRARRDTEIWRLRMSLDAAALVRAVLLGSMRLYGSFDEGECVRRIAEEFVAACEAEHEALGTREARGETRKRDNHQCQFPDCSRRATETDHIQLRSAGGSDDIWNLVSLCWIHHHAGKHRGRFRVRRTAADDPASGDLIFEIGTGDSGPRRVWKNDRLVGAVDDAAPGAGSTPSRRSR
jgi:hypothetical protein